MKLLRPQNRFSSFLLGCWLGICTMASAAPLPVNDNTAAPFTAVFSGGLDTHGTIHNEYFASWLGRSGAWVESFNGGTDELYTWTDFEGKDYVLHVGKRWVLEHPGNKYIFSTGMLPGTVVGGVGYPQSGHTLAKGANGDYDTHWQILAQRIVAHGPPDESIIIRLGWEFNGWWYPWCIKDGTTGMGPKDFANYFKHIVTVMKAVPGCEYLEFCWNGATNYTDYSVRDAYPADKDASGNIILPDGNKYVDYIGVDVYDTANAYIGATYPFSQAVLDAAWKEKQGKPATGGYPTKNNIYWWKMTAEEPKFGQGKPLCFPEWGLSSNTSKGGRDNPEFIRHMFEFIHESTNNVAWHCYFNTSAASNHRITSMPGGSASIHPVAQAKFKQLFGLPLPNNNNIGTVGISGTCDGITVSGAGAGYLTTGTTDNFFFSSRTSSTNDMLLVEIKSMASGTAAQSGVMLRQGFAAGDKYAAVFLRNGQCVFQSRTAAGFAVQNYAATLATPTPAAPVWLKLVRRGNSITGYYSTDGALNWAYAGGQTVALTGTAYVGLAVSSGNTTALNATVEDNIDTPDILTGLETGIASKIIKDNADATGITKSAGWGTGTTRTGKYGADYNSAGPALPVKTMTFTPTLAGTGLYDVYMRWPDYADADDLARDVPISVTSTAPVPDSLLAQQHLGKSLWNYVGTYSFSPTAGSLQVSSSTTGSGAYTMADAVLFVPLPQPSAPLVINPSFETDASGSQTITGWNESGTNPGASAVKSTIAGHNETLCYLGHYFATGPYDVFTYQTKTGLANGSYTLKAWVQRTGSQSTAQMEASGFGGTTMTAPINPGTTWVQITITGINVTNGTCTFGFRSISPDGGTSIKVDDVEFYKL